MIVRPKPTSVEKVMRENDFITSKTDLKGIITYGNEIFIEFAKYKESELLGVNHNIIRHPDMPRAVFKLMWDTIQTGQELNAYVKNLASDGSYYWVFANVTPVHNEKGKIVGYYSVRRKPKKSALDIIIPLYKQMLQIEKKHNPQEGMKAAGKYLVDLLSEKGVGYEEFIFSI